MLLFLSGSSTVRLNLSRFTWLSDKTSHTRARMRTSLYFNSTELNFNWIIASWSGTHPPITERSLRRWRVTSLSPRALCSDAAGARCSGCSRALCVRYYSRILYIINWLTDFLLKPPFVSRNMAESGQFGLRWFFLFLNGFSVQWHCRLTWTAESGLPDSAVFICY